MTGENRKCCYWLLKYNFTIGLFILLNKRAPIIVPIGKESIAKTKSTLISFTENFFLLLIPKIVIAYSVITAAPTIIPKIEPGIKKGG